MSGMISRRAALRRGATVATAGLATGAVPALLAVPEARADAVDEVAAPWDKLAELLDRAGAGRLFRPRERLFGALGVPKNHVYIDNRPVRILAPMDIDGGARVQLGRQRHRRHGVPLQGVAGRLLPGGLGRRARALLPELPRP